MEGFLCPYCEGDISTNIWKDVIAAKYLATSYILISTLYDSISINFDGPFPSTPFDKKFVLDAIEHLNWWPIAIATNIATALTMNEFMKKRIIYIFPSLQFVI